MAQYFYISTAGNDSTGTGAIGAHWLTRGHAQTAIRALLSTQSVDFVIVELDVTACTTTFALTSSDNGQNGFSVTWDLKMEAGTHVGSWSFDGALGCWKAALTTTVDPHAIWVNGNRCYQAKRHGNLSASSTITTNGFHGNSGDLDSVKNPTTIRFYFDGNYTKPVNRMVSVSASPTAPSVIVMQQPAHEYITGVAGTSGVGFAYANSHMPVGIANIWDDFSGDLRPGTFYYDLGGEVNATKYLYYCPLAQEDMSTAVVVAPNGLEQVLTTNGFHGGLRGYVRYGHWAMPEGFAERSQNMLYDSVHTRVDDTWPEPDLTLPPAAVTIIDSVVRMDQFDVTRQGVIGLHVYGSSVVTGNDICIDDTSLNGVVLGHPSEATGSVACTFNVTNITIAHPGREFTGSVGLFPIFWTNSTIDNVDILDCPYCGFISSLGGGIDESWNAKVQDNYFRKARIVRTCTDTIDGAAVKTNNKQFGTVGLTFEDIAIIDCHTNNANALPTGGIYLDEGSKNVKINRIVSRYTQATRSFFAHNIAVSNGISVTNFYADTSGTYSNDTGGDIAPDTWNAPSVSADPRVAGAAIMAVVGVQEPYATRHAAVMNNGTLPKWDALQATFTPRVWLKLNEGSGTTVTNYGSASGTATASGSGITRNATKLFNGVSRSVSTFDGSAGAVTSTIVSGVNFNNTDPFTVAMIVKPNLTRSGSLYAKYLITNATNIGFTLRILWTGTTGAPYPLNRVVLNAYLDDSNHTGTTGSEILTLGHSDLDNAPHLIHLVYDGMSGFEGLSLYVDGVKETRYYDFGTTISAMSSSHGLEVASQGGGNFPGDFGDALVYPAALRQMDIEASYRTAVRTGLLSRRSHSPRIGTRTAV